MDKIVDIASAIKLSKKLQSQGKSIVLAGGCFDLLHVGHITFLEKAKATGDSLFILLESDERIKKIKGENRPINNQHDRALILSAIQTVDYIILLSSDFKDQDYASLISKLKPSIIAITKGDPNKKQKELQGQTSGSIVKEVIDVISDISTTRLVKLLGEEL